MTGWYRGQLISINIWYQGQGETTGRASAPQIKQCFQCGTTDHVTDDCPEKEQGKSEGFDSCDRPSNLTQIGFK